jgi:hypothetical protein
MNEQMNKHTGKPADATSILYCIACLQVHVHQSSITAKGMYASCSIGFTKVNAPQHQEKWVIIFYKTATNCPDQ